MGYKRSYKRRGRSSSGFGGAVSDSASIANKFGPKGALITGVTGFLFFYVVVPWALVAWLDHNKAKMVSQNASMIGKMLDEVFIRRFVHPSEWAGVAILLVCVGMACWKAYARTDLDASGERDASWLARLIARFLD